MSSARARLDALRETLALRFRDAVVAPTRPVHGMALGSGLEALDAILPDGGLRPGDSARVHAHEGAGTVSLLAHWAREACRRGEPVAVVDATRSVSPHAFVEPPASRAPIFVLRPVPADALASLDIALRSGAFGLVVALGLPHPRQAVGPRLRMQARERQCRLLFDETAPLVPTFTVALQVAGIDWVEAPHGAVPRARRVVAEVGGRRTLLCLERHDTARVRPRDEGPDRRGEHANGGRARSRAGRR